MPTYKQKTFKKIVQDRTRAPLTFDNHTGGEIAEHAFNHYGRKHYQRPSIHGNRRMNSMLCYSQADDRQETTVIHFWCSYTQHGQNKMIGKISRRKHDYIGEPISQKWMSGDHSKDFSSRLSTME